MSPKILLTLIPKSALVRLTWLDPSLRGWWRNKLHAVSFSEAEQDYPEYEGSESAESEDVRLGLFARLFAKHDCWLYSHLVTLLGSSAHAR